MRAWTWKLATYASLTHEMASLFLLLWIVWHICHGRLDDLSHYVLFPWMISRIFVLFGGVLFAAQNKSENADMCDTIQDDLLECGEVQIQSQPTLAVTLPQPVSQECFYHELRYGNRLKILQRRLLILLGYCPYRKRTIR